MSEIPKVGDTVYIETERFEGEATITYIDEPHLYLDYSFPIQCEISEADLDQFEDFNHGQQMIRFNLKEILSIEQKRFYVATENIQGNLFDGF